MASPIVLIIFYSRSGGTEKRALAAGVGAVQGRALIRLRRLPDRSPAAHEPLRRMQKEYVAPAEADIRGANGIFLALPADAKTEDWKEFLDWIVKVSAEGQVVVKELPPGGTVDEATQLGREFAISLRDGANREARG